MYMTHNCKLVQNCQYTCTQPNLTFVLAKFPASYTVHSQYNIPFIIYNNNNSFIS